LPYLYPVTERPCPRPRQVLTGDVPTTCQTHTRACGQRKRVWDPSPKAGDLPDLPWRPVIGQLTLAATSLPLPQEPSPQPPKKHGAMPPRARTRGRYANPPRIASANAVYQPQRTASPCNKSHHVASSRIASTIRIASGSSAKRGRSANGERPARR
jgi:hypothetical protein